MELEVQNTVSKWSSRMTVFSKDSGEVIFGMNYLERWAENWYTIVEKIQTLSVD